MTTLWRALGVVGILATLSGGDLLACGDKWLVPSRGLRYELTPATRERAALLVYANPASAMPALFNKLSVDPSLRKAGYRPMSVATAEEFDRMLHQSAWDVVLLDLADGRRLPSSAATSAPGVVAVATGGTKAEIDQASKQFGTVVKSPTQSRAIIEALDGAILSRRAALERTANGTR